MPKSIIRVETLKVLVNYDAELKQIWLDKLAAKVSEAIMLE
jgi:hypothetical protein